jgi:methyltransferase
VTLLQGIVLALALLRLVELVHAERNTRRLKAAGGRTVGDGHYPLIILFHVAWLAVLWWLGGKADRPDWLPLATFGLLEALRLWVIVTLGRYWTTRIVTVPGAPLVAKGPYRWVRHPNYLILALEIPILLYAFGAPALAAIFGSVNILLLAHRLRVEEDALAPRRQAGPSPGQA